MPSTKKQLKNYFEANGITINTIKINGKCYQFDTINWENKERISSSSFHPVYSCEHRHTKRSIATKFVQLPRENDSAEDKEEKFKSISREIKLHHDLKNHLHIVDFYGVGFEKNDLIICMEKMEMALNTLYKKIHRDYRYFPERMLGYIVVAIVDAGSYCKEHDIMHRDLKPYNILVNRSGEIKLCDFGVSCKLENSLAQSRVGTIPYWPPEHYNSK